MIYLFYSLSSLVCDLVTENVTTGMEEIFHLVVRASRPPLLVQETYFIAIEGSYH
ncbi:MAG: hypothetical protein SAK29_01600 [Scytonema sp. PMC 1069.18]|nr:hypothetical protein [Scytonema sp. PMC 1069.18]MEC4880263.1 hypothetical protein [Scytonema sp. PMC 1070.18]